MHKKESIMDIDALSQVIRDLEPLRKGYIIHDGFVFRAVRNPANVFDAIVICNSSSANRFFGADRVSEHSLEDHIAFINSYQFTKAYVFADDISFLEKCPTLEHLTILPAATAGDGFDYSPLYKMPNLKSLICATHYGAYEKYSTTIDYSKIPGLEYLEVNSNEDLNYHLVPTLKTLHLFGPFGELKDHDLKWLSACSQLDTLEITCAKIHCLEGIERLAQMQCLRLNYNRSLQDISALESVAPTLRMLHIEKCPNIADFSVLEKLKNLEYLVIKGSNQIPDLSFLRGLPNLQMFDFDINVVDGDLSPCLALPYVRCRRSRRHYNLKDAQLPKGACKHGNENIPPWRRII
jgi:hypothetical protein